MVFSSLIFLFVFLPLALPCYYLACRTGWRNGLLFLFSMAFYAWGEPVYVLLLAASIVANWGFGLWTQGAKARRAGKRAVLFAVLFNAGNLFVFKYLDFALENAGWLLGRNFPLVQLALPIGISFYSFQAMSYVIDVYRGRCDALKNPLDVGLYIALFPQLIAGPIVRYETIALEIRHRRESLADFSDGVGRFIVGLAKKVILANQIGIVADMVFETPHASMSILGAWTGAAAYGLQIYFDFSGYSDMAIGLGRMFGFHFLENFNHPYVARSITEFWRRWHISLSTWFRDYVYFPMGGSRVQTRSRLVFNLFVVWMLTGIWHGANWTFVVWGMMYWACLVVEKTTGFARHLGRLGHGYALVVVLIGWVLFRSNSIQDALRYLEVMFGLAGSPLVDSQTVFYMNDYKAFFVAGILCCLPWAEIRLSRFMGNGHFREALHAAWQMGLLILSVSFLVKSDYNPFIYFNF